jgi:hypothetical protein
MLRCNATLGRSEVVPSGKLRAAYPKKWFGVSKCRVSEDQEAVDRNKILAGECRKLFPV